MISYDTVRLWLEIKCSSRVINRLSAVRVVTDYSRAWKVFRGQFRGLNVDVRPSTISVHGSLPKYFLGDNLHGLTRSQVREAIEQLSEELNLPMARAKVTRLDIGDNFEMLNSVSSYLRNLGTCPGYKRVEEYRDESLTYKNKERSISLYDKSLEMLENGESVNSLKGKHMLRYELRLIEKPAQKLGRDRILVNELWGESIFPQLVGMWKANYDAISKINPWMGHVDLSSVRAMEQSLAEAAICFLGSNLSVRGQIQGEVKLGHISKRLGGRLSKRLRELSPAGRGQSLKSSPVILELDGKVEEAASAALDAWKESHLRLAV